MVIESIVARYGLLAVLVGAGIEGEAVVVTAGILAQRGYLPLIPTAICAASGSFAVDQFWFHAARRMRERPWVRKFTGRSAYRKALAALERHQTGFILAFRFIYGMRTVSPIAIGTSNVASKRFLVLNLIAAAAWGPIFTGIGFEFGKAALPIIRKLGPILFVMAAVVALLLLAIVGFRARWGRGGR